MKNIIVAIDGPAASGKSTVSKIIAERLNFNYLDTGAMYRCITLFTLQSNVSPDDELKIKELLKDCHISFENNKCFLNGKDVSLDIRKQDVTAHVSQVCAYKDVREHMVFLQREMSKSRNVILDGRDIGTNVFPNADVKIYLVSSVKTRAERRFYDNLEKGIHIPLNELEKDIERRDHADSTRPIAPLKKADDAILVDNSYMNIEETAQHIINIIKKKIGE